MKLKKFNVSQKIKLNLKKIKLNLKKIKLIK